ncbi:hypothetical protein pdul_cds_573 [Pandoravirus dulcis]|uniref:Uncharacterized protein n=1 Tax=Pandoravirus dulcis TaxID=1349409 RepID=S4VX81_9VIRU|nr:hypothetical protein pdul_cds_573 [Pandoravirus dulcis]AGO82691.1 hypothetical protein pdul_cds_573 [Pandoravirus dulcis]
MGTTHSMVQMPGVDHHGRVVYGGDSNVGVSRDPADVRRALMACVDLDKGAVDAAALLAAEHRHNQTVAVDVLRAMSHGDVLSVQGIECLLENPDENAPHGHSTGARAYHVSSDAPVLHHYTEAAVADAIATAVSAGAALLLWTRSRRGTRTLDSRLGIIGDRMWLPTVVRALALGPGLGPWTGDCMARMRLLLDFVVQLCARRNRERSDLSAEHAFASRLAQYAMCSKDDLQLSWCSISGTSADASRYVATCAERRAREMLVWLSALERTPVVAEHLLPGSARSGQSHDQASGLRPAECQQ